jgi:hypothetical protein
VIAADPPAHPGHHHRHYRGAEERRADAGKAAIDRGRRQRSFLQNRIVTTEDQPVDHHLEGKARRAIVCPADLLVGLPVDHRPEKEKRKSTVRPLDLLLDLPADRHQDLGLPADHLPGGEERRAMARTKAAGAVEAQAMTDPNRHPKLSLRKKSHQRRIAVIGDWESDHRLGVEADRRPGAAEGRIAGVARGADRHPWVAAAEKRTAAIVHEPKGDTKAALLADHHPRKRPIAVEAAATVREGTRATTDRAENTAEDLPAAVAAGHDPLLGALAGREDRGRHPKKRFRKTKIGVTTIAPTAGRHPDDAMNGSIDAPYVSKSHKYVLG